MNRFLQWTVLLFASALLRCAASPDAAGDMTHPPLPRTPSILPLAVDNTWDYTYRRYDSSGTRGAPLPDDNAAIPGMYGLRGDSTLELLDRYQSIDSGEYEEFVYQYEWEDVGRGILLAYRDVAIPVRGLYIVGEYARDSAWLYDSAILWLAYPADSGFAWRKGADSTAPTMEILSTRETFYCVARDGGASPLQFRECYHYRETDGDTAWHYFFNDTVGCLGIMQYVNNQIRVTCLLNRYQVAED